MVAPGDGSWVVPTEQRATEQRATSSAGRAPTPGPASVMGIESGRYHVVPRTLVFVRQGERVLLQRRAIDRPIWPGRYNGVGGHVEAGEGLVASALREVREETGLEVSDLRLAGLLHVTDDVAPEGVLVAVFTARSDTTAVRASIEGDFAWVALDEVAGLDVVPDLAAILPRLWPEGRDAPFVALSRPRAGAGPAAAAAAGHAEGEPFFIE